jgi:hypothetical protein
MKTLKILFLGLLFVATYYACSPKLNLTSNSAMLTEKLNNIVANWDSMSPEVSNSTCTSYLDDVGVRIRYMRAKPELGLFVVESIVGKKAFVKGPHTRGVNCSSDSSFGHYDPAFINRLQEVLKLTFNSKVFVDRFQPFYDQELKQYLRTYYLSYQTGTTSEAIREGYLIQLDSSTRDENPSWYLQESFRTHANEMEAKGYDWYESNTCAGFWVRRSIDGTADEFYGLLKLAMELFDPGFEQS